MGGNDFGTKGNGSFLLKDAEVHGNVKSDKDVYLEGFIEGDVHSAGRIIVTALAKVDGDIYCEELLLNGTITGNAHVNNLAQLGEYAVIKGHLITTGLQIHPDAKIGKGLRLREKKSNKKQ